MTTAPVYNLAEVTEQYLLRQGNDRRKYFSRYLSIAEDVYKSLFRRILPSTLSKQVEVINDPNEQYPYIWTPENMERFYSISVPNKKGELIDVLYNEKLNVFPPPQKKKSCGCVTNDLCDCIDNLQLISTPKDIDGTIFTEKRWLKCCANGDVIEYKEVPVKKYGTDGGSYNNDYGNDYDIISATSTVDVLKITTKLGRLETKDCGCPLETEHNKHLIYKECGCFLGIKSPCCQKWYSHAFSCTGEYKFSECGDKIYLKNVRTETGFVVISMQPNAVNCGQEVLIRDYEKEAIWFGIDFQSISFFPAASPNSKEYALIAKRRAETELFEFLNPMSRERFFHVTAEIKL